MADEKKNQSNKTENQNLSEETTVASEEAVMPVAEKQGEVAVDEGAEANLLQEQASQERIDDAKAEAMRNHAREHENDNADYETVISSDRVDNGK